MDQKILFIFLFVFHIGMVKSNCVLNMNQDLTNNHPIIMSPNEAKWVSLSDSAKGSLNINRDQTVKLACTSRDPTKKNAFNKIKAQNVITAKCKSGTTFEVNGNTFSFDDLQCDSPAEVSDVRTGQQCLGQDSELIKVGFKVGNDFIEEYRVCFDTKRKIALFTEVTVPATIEKSSTAVRDTAWVSSNEGLFNNLNMNSLYSCETQKETFRKILNKDWFGSNRCCLEKGKLVNNKDLVFGPEQAATSHYLNAVPQWSTCNRANWLEVEKRVRDLAVSLKHPLTVWTGTYRSMTLAAKWGLSYKDMHLHYNSDSDRAVPVPLYIWKVIFDQQTQKGVAVIEINNPHLSLTDIESLVLCDDICKNVNWLNFLDRKTITSGYVYCCDLNNFEFGFAFKNSPFPRPAGGILRQ